MLIVFSDDVKKRVNKIHTELYKKYGQQAKLERDGQTPPWALFERAKQLFGPVEQK